MGIVNIQGILFRSFIIDIPKVIPDETNTEVSTEIEENDIVDYVEIINRTSNTSVWVILEFEGIEKGLSAHREIGHGISSRINVGSARRSIAYGNKVEIQAPVGAKSNIKARCFHKQNKDVSVNLIAYMLRPILRPIEVVNQ